MRFSRILEYGMRGDDVLFIKEALVHLGYLPRCTKNTFLGDTRRAVRYFQGKHGMKQTGKVDAPTWELIVSALEATPDANEPIPVVTGEVPNNISPEAMALIARDLAKVSPERQQIVLDILRFAYDPKMPREWPTSLYGWGKNLYTKEKTLYLMDVADIQSAAQRYPDYYDGGRAEMQIAAVKAEGDKPASDCSGSIVGYLRRYGYVDSGFDATSTGLAGKSHSTAIAEAQMLPGDWVWRKGHIGTYVGGGYVVEWVGGAFGCQLTKYADRRVYDFVARRERKYSAWTKCLRPKYY